METALGLVSDKTQETRGGLEPLKYLEQTTLVKEQCCKVSER